MTELNDYRKTFFKIARLWVSIILIFALFNVLMHAILK